MIKSVFKITMGDVSHSITSEEQASDLGVSTQYGDFLTALKVEERNWRNKELNNTDWMLVSDATYKGEPLVGSQYLEDIKAYRQSLREYNLTTDDRPEKPEWFK